MTVQKITDERQLAHETAMSFQALEGIRHDVVRASFEAKTSQIEYLLAAQQLRPCFMTPIKVEHDGLHWVCQAINIEGVVGGGDSPNEAMIDFDRKWNGNQK